MNIELKDFELAAERLKPILHHTELDHSATFSAMTGGDIYLKCENRQKTGSFKIRGASNKIAALMERGGLQAVVASSAGNHAQGVACAARKFGIPATIVMRPSQRYRRQRTTARGSSSPETAMMTRTSAPARYARRKGLPSCTRITTLRSSPVRALSALKYSATCRAWI